MSVTAISSSSSLRFILDLIAPPIDPLRLTEKPHRREYLPKIQPRSPRLCFDTSSSSLPRDVFIIKKWLTRHEWERDLWQRADQSGGQKHRQYVLPRIELIASRGCPKKFFFRNLYFSKSQKTFFLHETSYSFHKISLIFWLYMPLSIESAFSGLSNITRFVFCLNFPMELERKKSVVSKTEMFKF